MRTHDFDSHPSELLPPGPSLAEAPCAASASVLASALDRRTESAPGQILPYYSAPWASFVPLVEGVRCGSA